MESCLFYSEMIFLMLIIVRLAMLRQTLSLKKREHKFLGWGGVVLCCMIMLRIADGRLDADIISTLFFLFICVVLWAMKAPGQ